MNKRTRTPRIRYFHAVTGALLTPAQAGQLPAHMVLTHMCIDLSDYAVLVLS